MKKLIIGGMIVILMVTSMGFCLDATDPYPPRGIAPAGDYSLYK